MITVEDCCKKALGMGIEEAKVINPDSIITADWVRIKCQFGCHRFGKTLCCPPYTPTPDLTRKVIDSYHKAILLHKTLEKVANTGDFNKIVVRLEIEMFLDGYYKAWSMGSGPCRICNECDPTNLCKYGLEARPSMEACGIDVFGTVRTHGFSIEVIRNYDSNRNHYGLLLLG